MKVKNTLIERATAVIIFECDSVMGITDEEIAWKKRVEKRLNDYLHSKKFIKDIYTDYGREIATFKL